MKQNYEQVFRYRLVRRMPAIMRLDGRAFHSLTRRKKYEKPFCKILAGRMVAAAFAVLEDAQGAKCAYLQSDEINILLTDYDTLTTEAWFGGVIQKIASVAASIAAARFTMVAADEAHFDCRVFSVPREEVCNYFIWRQRDWERNSLQMLARSHFSHRELHGKSKADMHEMLHGVGMNWTALPEQWRRGTFINRETLAGWVLTDCPVFGQERDSIERYLEEQGI